jgi:hypothetical protein
MDWLMTPKQLADIILSVPAHEPRALTVLRQQRNLTGQMYPDVPQGKPGTVQTETSFCSCGGVYLYGTEVLNAFTKHPSIHRVRVCIRCKQIQYSDYGQWKDRD